MFTIELHLQPQRFTPLFDGDRHTVTVDGPPTTSPGNHLVIQEYTGTNFTGRWIRGRVVDVETQPGDCATTLVLETIARSKSPTLRHRAA